MKTFCISWPTIDDNSTKRFHNLADNKMRAGDVAQAVSRNFDKLPENVRNDLLVKLADNNNNNNNNNNNKVVVRVRKDGSYRVVIKLWPWILLSKNNSIY